MGCEIYRPKPWTDAQRTPLGRHKVYPGRIQQARQARGFDRVDAAKELGMPIWRLKAIEDGAEEVNGPELARMAMALRFPLAFFKHEFDSPDMQVISICGDGPTGETCSRCPCLSTVLCDYPVGEGRTCDLALCEACAVEQMPATETAESIDYCPQHALIAQGLVTLKAGQS
jgi:hypothetical protein